jgi:4-methyl-5(b-hydroxyethyl)-thiazole monophosphate biosynthesis
VLAALHDNSITITDNAVEIDGNIVTSRSAGTAMDFALTLIELLSGKEKREEINLQLAR